MSRTLILPGRQGLVLARSCRAFWPLNEAGGTRLDAVGDLDVAESGGTLGQAAGKIGNAAVQSGAANLFLARSDDPVLSPPGSFTWTAWVLLTTLGAHRGVLSKHAGATVEYTLRYDRNDLKWRWEVNGTAVEHAASPSTGTWYFLRVWYDHGSGEIGIEVDESGSPATAPGAARAATAGELRLCADHQGSGLNGRLDAAGLWHHVLTPGDGAFLYNEGAGREWPFG